MCVILPQTDMYSLRYYTISTCKIFPEWEKATSVIDSVHVLWALSMCVLILQKVLKIGVWFFSLKTYIKWIFLIIWGYKTRNFFHSNNDVLYWTSQILSNGMFCYWQYNTLLEIWLFQHVIALSKKERSPCAHYKKGFPMKELVTTYRKNVCPTPFLPFLSYQSQFVIYLFVK